MKDLRESDLEIVIDDDAFAGDEIELSDIEAEMVLEDEDVIVVSGRGHALPRASKPVVFAPGLAIEDAVAAELRDAFARARVRPLPEPRLPAPRLPARRLPEPRLPAPRMQESTVLESVAPVALEPAPVSARPRASRHVLSLAATGAIAFAAAMAVKLSFFSPAAAPVVAARAAAQEPVVVEARAEKPVAAATPPPSVVQFDEPIAITVVPARPAPTLTLAPPPAPARPPPPATTLTLAPPPTPSAVPAPTHPLTPDPAPASTPAARKRLRTVEQELADAQLKAAFR